jgi:hypothetical protein
MSFSSWTMLGNMHRNWRLQPAGLVVFFIVVFFIHPTAEGQGVRFRDHSDWWSINNESFHRLNVKPLNKDMGDGSFRVADVTLGPDQFNDLAAKFGKVRIVERGDASNGRQQACYFSIQDSARVYLIFEFGEDESAFYLFSSGANWKGNELCGKIKVGAMNLNTTSGVRLGITRDRLDTILGKPDVVAGDKVAYSRETKVRTSPQEFEKLRAEYPQKLGDQAAHTMFDYYPVETYIEARFVDSRLNYLAVSKSSGID